MSKLNVKSIEAAVARGKPDRMSDGAGLYLSITPRKGDGASAKWTLRYRHDGRDREMGLGTFPQVSLADARRKASQARQAINAGHDPIQERQDRREERATARRNTFEHVSLQMFQTKQAQWRSERHRKQSLSSLRRFVFPVIGSRPVADVNIEDVLRVLRPIWNDKPVTASRVRGQIEAVISYAKALKLRTTGENPAIWRGNLNVLLPAPGKVVGKEKHHYPALRWQEMPALMAELRSKDSIPALALQFAILTAARTGEVRYATWAEIDLFERIWTVPGEHTKGGRPHRVPLSDAAAAVLSRLVSWASAKPAPTDFVFFGRARCDHCDYALDKSVRPNSREI
jgi:integrase